MSREDARYSRLREAMGAKNNRDLSRKLNVCRASIEKHSTVPAAYLLKAVAHGFNPAWIEDGTSPKYLILSNFPYLGEYPRMKVGTADEFPRPIQCTVSM